MTRIEWNHPTHGRISEIVCETHSRVVLSALRALGIGCVGEPAEGTCLRCVHVYEQPRAFIAIAREVNND